MKRLATTIITSVAVALIAGQASAAVTAAQKCEASKKKVAAAYYACRQKVEATAVTKGDSPDYAKCIAKFTEKWDAAETKGGGECPDLITTDDMGTLLDDQSDEASDVMHGGAVESCVPDPCGTAGGIRVIGRCWFLGASGQSCDDVCTGAGLAYDVATKDDAGSGAATSAGCAAVSAAFGGGFIADVGGCPVGLGCNTSGMGPVSAIRCTSPDTTSSDSLAPKRFCACR